MLILKSRGRTSEIAVWVEQNQLRSWDKLFLTGYVSSFVSGRRCAPVVTVQTRLTGGRAACDACWNLDAGTRGSRGIAGNLGFHPPAKAEFDVDSGVRGLSG